MAMLQIKANYLLLKSKKYLRTIKMLVSLLKLKEFSMKRVLNFSAGPATLPLPVLQEASRGILEIDGSGMSVLEVSHRGKQYESIHFDAIQRLQKLLGLSEKEYTVLFLGGGASLQFSMLPMNFLTSEKSADYIHTGEWSQKAAKEAKLFGKVNIVASSEGSRFTEIPKTFTWNESSLYSHLTTNNTIEGTQFHEIPNSPTPLTADMSSDFLSRKLDYSKFSLFYAGAQKNAGPGGVTIVVLKNSWLAQAKENIPVILSYQTHTKSQSLYNTPPVFAIYVFSLVLKWIENEGGLSKIQERNERKAQAIYDALEEYPEIYDTVVKSKKDRSLMNVVFRLKDESKEKDFLSLAQGQGMDGLKGHRSVGGFRASIYNAFPEEGCYQLAEVIRKFAKA